MVSESCAVCVVLILFNWKAGDSNSRVVLSLIVTFVTYALLVWCLIVTLVTQVSDFCTIQCVNIILCSLL